MVMVMVMVMVINIFWIGLFNVFGSHRTNNMFFSSDNYLNDDDNDNDEDWP